MAAKRLERINNLLIEGERRGYFKRHGDQRIGFERPAKKDGNYFQQPGQY